MSRSIRKMKTLRTSGKRSRGLVMTASSASRPPIISGAWGIPGLAAPVPRFSSTMATRFSAARLAARIRMGIASSKSGTWSSCNSWKNPPARVTRCRGLPLIPAWGWNASPLFCKASTTITIPTRCARLSWRVRKRPGRTRMGRSGPATAWWQTICAPAPFCLPMACCLPMKAAAMCCAGSCAAPCGMRI